MFGKEWVDIGIEAVQMLLEPMVRIFFLANVLTTKYNKKNTQFFYVFGMFILGMLGYLTNFKIDYQALHSIFFWGLDICCVLFLFKDRLRRKIGMYSMYIVALCLAEVAGYIVRDITNPGLTPAEFYDLPFRRFFSAFVILVFSAVFVTIVCIVNRVKIKDALSVIGIETALTVMEIFLSYSVYKSSSGFSSSKILLITIVALLPAAIVNLLVYDVVVRSAEIARKEREREFIEQKNKSEYEYYRLATENENKLREIRHDLINNLQTAKILFEQGEKEKALSVIDEINSQQQKTKPVVYCDNAIVNTVLSLKIRKADENKIKTKCKIADKLNSLPLSDVELSSLMTNLFDNAIKGAVESGSDSPYISIEIGRHSDNYYFIFENSVSKSVKENNKKLKTTKADKENHGYGKKIIRKIAEQHGGSVLTELNDEYISVSVLI